MSIITISGPSAITPALQSWDGNDIVFDNMTMNTKLELPAASALSAGWSPKSIRKVDPSSYTIEVRPTAAGDTLNHFWNKDCKYGQFINMTQQATGLLGDGSSRFWMDGHTLHRDSPQSQRTVTIPSWDLTPQSRNEIVRCNCTTAGGWITILIDDIAHWCPPSPVTGGNYLSYNVWIQKAADDNAPQGVVICTRDGSHIKPNNDNILNPSLNRGYLYLTRPGDTAWLYIAADGATVNGFFRKGDIPQTY